MARLMRGEISSPSRAKSLQLAFYSWGGTKGELSAIVEDKRPFG